MNKKYFCIILLITICNLAQLNAQIISGSKLDITKSKYTNRILRESDLPAVLKDIPNDKFLEIERLASYLFHQLLNQYRIRNKLKPLNWDDRLWLAARNHNVYMANVKYGHEETNSKSSYYTGTDQSIRVQFVMDSDENLIVSENIQYYKSWLRFYVVTLPETSIINWKNSPSHDANMLDINHVSEGTSIYIDNKTKLVYATSVFLDEKLPNSKPIRISWNYTLEAIYKNYKGEKNDKYYKNELNMGN